MQNRVSSILFLLLVVGLITNQPFLITLAVSILIIIGIAWLWQKRSLFGVVYTRSFHYSRGFPGEKIQLRIDVENKKILPISWLRIQDSWENAVGPEDESILAPSHIKNHGYLTNIFSLRWFEKKQRRYTLLLRKRGVYEIGPAKIDSGDLFGIFENLTNLNKITYLTVFPKIIDIESLDFPTEDPYGYHRSARRLFEDSSRPVGIRDYKPEDDFRWIHWPTTARTGELHVKLFEPTIGRIMVICLNISTYEHHWQGIKPELLEHLIEIAATIADQGVREGYKVGLIANGCLAHADQPFRVPAGRSPQQLGILLEALAGVTPIVSANFENFLLREIPRIQYGATLVILTSIVTPELAPILLQVKRHERKIMLYSVGNEEIPVIPGIQTIHRPYNESGNE